MRRRLGRLVGVLSVLALCASCASGGAGSKRAARGDRSLLTQQQLREYHFSNAFEAVSALRANWLVEKGTDSFVSPTRVWVYLDDMRLGGVESLRTIATPTIAYIRYIDGVTASSRWGLNHGQGVIYVATQ